MARPLRVEYAGALYHVMNRGNRRERVFRKRADYELFVARLGRFAGEFSVDVLSYCLMPNHFHLFLRTREANLSRFMQALLTSFTISLNRRENSSGHLFQGRFKAQVVEGVGYFDMLSRYIHLNPVRVKTAKVLPVEERRRLLAEFGWSSFPAAVGLAPTPEWLRLQDVLQGFGASRREQMKGYRLYVEEGLMSEVADPAEAMRVRSILGSDSFGEWVKRELLLRSPVKDRREQRELVQLHGGFALRTVVDAVAAAYGIHAPSLYRRGCRNREARQLALLAASRHCRGTVRMADIARKFGISQSGLALAALRMEKRVNGKGQLGRRYQAVKTALLPHAEDRQGVSMCQ